MSGYSNSSKAADTSLLSLSFDPSSSVNSVGQSFSTTIKLRATSSDVFLRGFDTRFAFDTTKLQLTNIEYLFGQASSGLGNTPTDLSSINSTGKIKVIGEFTSLIGQQISTSDIGLVRLTFSVTSTSGTTIKMSRGKFYSIGSDAILTENTISTPNTIDINGGGTIGATPTPGATGNNVLNLKLKFQGISSTPANGQTSMTVKVGVSGCGLSAITYATGTFVANSSGIWSGAVGFNLASCTSGTYILYVKGPHHVQEKICDAAPSETNLGTYNCSVGKIGIVAGQNTFDFSNILLLAGDLDQNGVVDSVDLAMIRNNLGKTDATNLSKEDVNLDGKIDTQDFSLVISALSMKVDEL
jgi:hypothetical protein